jgi:hypothetical protein
MYNSLSTRRKVSTISLAGFVLQNIFRISPTAILSAVDLAAHFQLVKQIFAPEAFESAALAFTADFDWPDGALSRDRDLLLHSLGSLDMVLEHDSAFHRAAGLNPSAFINGYLMIPIFRSF